MNKLFKLRNDADGFWLIVTTADKSSGAFKLDPSGPITKTVLEKAFLEQTDSAKKCEVCGNAFTENCRTCFRGEWRGEVDNWKAEREGGEG